MNFKSFGSSKRCRWVSSIKLGRQIWFLLRLGDFFQFFAGDFTSASRSLAGESRRSFGLALFGGRLVGPAELVGVRGEFLGHFAFFACRKRGVN